MCVMRTTEDSTDPIRKLVSSQKILRFDHLALAVYPLGLYGVEPRTLLGQQATDDPHAASALFDAAVVRTEPAPDLPRDVPACVVLKMRSSTFLPAAWSFSQHHERNCVVTELTGRPS